jgi:hypothetical protein
MFVNPTNQTPIIPMLVANTATYSNTALTVVNGTWTIIPWNTNGIDPAKCTAADDGNIACYDGTVSELNPSNGAVIASYPLTSPPSYKAGYLSTATNTFMIGAVANCSIVTGICTNVNNTGYNGTANYFTVVNGNLYEIAANANNQYALLVNNGTSVSAIPFPSNLTIIADVVMKSPTQLFVMGLNNVTPCTINGSSMSCSATVYAGSVANLDGLFLTPSTYFNNQLNLATGVASGVNVAYNIFSVSGL